MKRSAAIFLLTAFLTVGAAGSALAGSWQKNETGWWYRNDDGSWPASSWQWLDGNGDGTAECYYFGADGYMLEETTTPDRYTVDKNGAWTVGGIVQTRPAGKDSVGNGAKGNEAEEKVTKESGAKENGTDGWRYEDGCWKFYENGRFLKNTWKLSGKNWYYLTGDGTMATGLIAVDGGRYYLNKDGSLRMSDFEEGGIYYLVDSSGRITGERRASGPDAGEGKGRFDSESESEVFETTNWEREAAGLKPLSWDDRLAQCARTRAVEIGGDFAHTRPDGSSWKTVMDEAGIATMAWGENIAKGQLTAEEVMEDWMESEGHRDNILKDAYEKMGAACYVEDGVHHWVQLFIK